MHPKPGQLYECRSGRAILEGLRLTLADSSLMADIVVDELHWPVIIKRVDHPAKGQAEVVWLGFPTNQESFPAHVSIEFLRPIMYPEIGLTAEDLTQGTAMEVRVAYHYEAGGIVHVNVSNVDTRTVPTISIWVKGIVDRVIEDNVKVRLSGTVGEGLDTVVTTVGELRRVRA